MLLPCSPLSFAQYDLRFRRISRWRPSWISELNDFSDSESLCSSSTSHQVLAQSDLPFGRRCRLKNFKMAAMPSWISDRNDFSNSESLCHSDASHQVSAQSVLWFGRCPLKYFKMATVAPRPSWISERNDFSNSESTCSHNVSHKVSAQSDLQVWRRCRKYEKLTMDDRRWTDD